MSLFDHDSRTKEIVNFYKLLQSIESLQQLGAKYGIADIFQDNNAKILQTLIFAGLEPITKRAGNDAHDLEHEYELKTANENLVSAFSTHHHLTKNILKKYRSVAWLFSIYDNIELKEIWVLEAGDLEKYFEKWEKKLEHKSHLNNPKIPFSHIRAQGRQVFAEKDVFNYKSLLKQSVS